MCVFRYAGIHQRNKRGLMFCIHVSFAFWDWAWCSYSTGRSSGKCPAGCSGQISATAAPVRQTQKWAGRTSDGHVMMMKSGNWSRGRGEMCSDKQQWPHYNGHLTSAQRKNQKNTRVCVCEDVPHRPLSASVWEINTDRKRHTNRGWNSSVVRTAQCTLGRDSITIRLWVTLLSKCITRY